MVQLVFEKIIETFDTNPSDEKKSIYLFTDTSLL